MQRSRIFGDKAVPTALAARLGTRRLSNGEIVDEDDIEDPDVESEPHFPGVVDRYETYGPRLRQLLDASTPDDRAFAGCHTVLNGLNPNDSHPPN